MRCELPKLHPSLIDMLPERSTFKLSRNVALQFTDDIGPTNPKFGGKRSPEFVKQYVFRMLAMTQIPFELCDALDGDFFWHADLRPPNVNERSD